MDSPLTDAVKSAIVALVSPRNFLSDWYKNDIKRVRVGTKQYRSHAVQILEKSQSEVYTDFKSLHPDVQISQRSFEKCKPFFIRAAKA
jgi:hypothetical protein